MTPIPAVLVAALLGAGQAAPAKTHAFRVV